MNDTAAGLALLRKPFPAHQISKLPKPTKQQTDEVKADFRKGIRCQICGTWHHPDVVHLDYVGHAALTDRLLDADPAWTWEPLSIDQASGLPVIDNLGGLWIKLTVCGVTRLGYGDAQGKEGPNAIKECIGDALRNAAMRFGAALELWHKGDLHIDEESDEDRKAREAQEARENELRELALFMVDSHQHGKDLDAIRVWYDPKTWSSDNPTESEERKFVWGLLKNESKLRSTIKANNPSAKQEQAAAN